MAAIYFHIPFCKRLCGYCDFLRSVKIQHIPQVVEMMHKELEEQHSFLTEREIKTIYFGGGTPSLLHPSEIERFIDHCRALFDCSTVEEITVEVNPDDITEQYVAELAKSSVNRISMGIQSLDNQCLKFMGRRHSAEQAVEAVRRLREGGFDNISVDVIFGVDGFGGHSLERTLQGILDLDVEHISAYHLTIEPTTRFGRALAKGEIKQVSEQCSEDEFMAVHQALTAAGYEHYEVSNFAKSGYRSRHNSSYWTGSQYLGIGTGAHSFNGNERRWCEQRVEEYIQGATYGSETLSADEKLNEYLMVSLRRIEGFDLQTVADKWGTKAAERIAQSCKPFVERGWLVKNGDNFAIPATHFLVSDTIIGELFC
ncbi:MAG: radical SAM family heme chaperone HemW [Alistipes sp.]|nr:radical SAM family heme chaperone HemW [Alistipes sp.]